MTDELLARYREESQRGFHGPAALFAAKAGAWPEAIASAMKAGRHSDVWRELPQYGIPDQHAHRVLDWIEDSPEQLHDFLHEYAEKLPNHVDPKLLRRAWQLARPSAALTRQNIEDHPDFKLSDEQERLMHGANFWNDYEMEVHPRHFAAVQHLHGDGTPVTLTDHRGNTGTSDDEWVKEHLPHLEHYAAATQRAVLDDATGDNWSGMQIKNLRGAPHVLVYRGVGGTYAQKVREALNHDAGTNEVDKKNLTLPTASMSSWSVNPDIAKRFAVSRGHIEEQPNGHGLVIHKWMPLSDLLHSGWHDIVPGQPHAHTHEAELVFRHKKNQLKVNTKEIYQYQKGDEKDWDRWTDAKIRRQSSEKLNKNEKSQLELARLRNQIAHWSAADVGAVDRPHGVTIASAVENLLGANPEPEEIREAVQKIGEMPNSWVASQYGTSEKGRILNLLANHPSAPQDVVDNVFLRTGYLGSPEGVPIHMVRPLISRATPTALAMMVAQDRSSSGGSRTMEPSHTIHQVGRESLAHPNIRQETLDQVHKEILAGVDGHGTAESFLRNPKVSAEQLSSIIGAIPAGSGSKWYSLAHALVAHPNFGPQHVDQIIDDPTKPVPLGAYEKSIAQERHLRRIADSPNTDARISLAQHGKDLPIDVIHKLAGDPHFRVRQAIAKRHGDQLDEEMVAKLLKDKDQVIQDAILPKMQMTQNNVDAAVNSGARVRHEILKKAPEAMLAKHLDGLMANHNQVATNAIGGLTQRKDLSPELQNKIADWFLSHPKKGHDWHIEDDDRYSSENAYDDRADHLRRLLNKPGIDPNISDKLVRGLSGLTRFPFEAVIANPSTPSHLVDHLIDGADAEGLTKILQVQQEMDYGEKTALQGHHLDRIYQKLARPVKDALGEEIAYQRKNYLKSLLTNQPQASADLLTNLAADFTAIPRGSDIYRTALSEIIDHPNTSVELLRKLHTDGAPVLDQFKHTIERKLSEHDPDTSYKEHADVKIGNVRNEQIGVDKKGNAIIKKIGHGALGQLRKIRDFILEKNPQGKELAPKALPAGDWSVGRADNGNISADKIQQFIDAIPPQRWNLSHSTWDGAQRHSDEDSKVLQVNLTTDQVNKMKQAGVWSTFKDMHHATMNSSHPVGPHTIGWIRYTGSPKVAAQFGTPDDPQEWAAWATNERKNLVANTAHREDQPFPPEGAIADFEEAVKLAHSGRSSTFDPEAQRHIRYYELARPYISWAQSVNPKSFAPQEKKLGAPGFFVDEVQSDFGQSFTRQAANEMRERAQAEARQRGMTAEEAQTHVTARMGEAQAEAERRWPDADYKKIHDILFQGRHPNEVLSEVFMQHLRDKKLHNTLVHWHTVGSKAPLSGLQANKPAPGHFNVTYNDVPKRLGGEPSHYGKLETESNPEMKGKVQTTPQPHVAGPGSDVLNMISDIDAAPKDAEKVWEIKVRKSEFAQQLDQWLDLRKSEVQSDPTSVAQAYHGSRPDVEHSLEAAQFLSGSLVPTMPIRKALWFHEPDHESGALASFGIEPSEKNLKALRAIKNLKVKP